MCIVFSIIGYVYWCLGVIFYRVCSLLGVRMWALWDPMIICITLSYLFCERDEWPSPKDSESLSFPSLHSLLMWLYFMFDLSRSPLFFTYHCFAIIFIVACDSSHSLHILFSPYSDPSRVRYFASSLHISLPVHFASFVSLSTSYSQ